jgi:hypothetical protein
MNKSQTENRLRITKINQGNENYNFSLVEISLIFNKNIYKLFK